jgi:hypothetical protein
MTELEGERNGFVFLFWIASSCHASLAVLAMTKLFVYINISPRHYEPLAVP